MLPIRDHNPSQRIPYVTYLLIAANAAIWLWTVAAFPGDQVNRLYYDYAMIPARLTAGENVLSLVSSVFLHGGFMHLAGNMLFLWIFGDNLEEEMGHGRFAVFYLACGAGAALAQWASGPWSPIPTIGASGAIAGVMGGYLLLFPKAKVDVLIFLIVFVRIIPIPAWIMLGLWFAMQLFQSVGSDAMAGGVAYWAHSGGFIIGVVLALPVWLRHGGTGFWRATQGHPPHPEAKYPLVRTSVPAVRRSK